MAQDFEAALEPMGEERRSFIKKLAMGTVFAVPTVASFTMTGIDAVYAQTPSSSGDAGDGEVSDSGVDTEVDDDSVDATTTTSEPDGTTTTTQQPNQTTTTTTTQPNQP